MVGHENNAFCLVDELALLCGVTMVYYVWTLCLLCHRVVIFVIVIVVFVQIHPFFFSFSPVLPAILPFSPSCRLCLIMSRNLLHHAWQEQELACPWQQSDNNGVGFSGAGGWFHVTSV